MKLFISYCRADKPFVEKLSDELRRHGIDTWIDTGEVGLGESFVRKIEEGLEECEAFAIVLSPDAVRSRWVREELEAALVDQISGKSKKVIPILYRECDIPPFLRAKIWVEFRDTESDEQRFTHRVGVLVRHLTQAPQHEEVNLPVARVISQKRETITVTLLTAVTGTAYRIEVPMDALVESVKSALVKQLGLPTSFGNGAPVFYQLVRKTGKTLSSHLSIRQNGVQDGEILKLSIEAVAG